MPKSHMKRMSAPKSWVIDRKETTYITRPNPGAHSFQYGMPLSVVIREIIKLTRTAGEAKKIVKTKDVLVDKRKRTDEKHLVGLMDIIELPQLEQYFRMTLDAKGRITAVKADAKESTSKISRIEKKTKRSGNVTQLNLSDGRNITADKDTYKIGDSLQISLPDQKILNHFKLEKGSVVLLISGKHAGLVANVESVQDPIITIQSKGQKHEVHKKHAFIIGKEKPILDSLKVK